MTHPSHHHAHGADDSLARLLDLDAQVHGSLLDDAIDAVGRHIEGNVHRVLDVGAGTGSSTFRLADRYPNAQIIALDVDAGRSAQVRERASAEGVRSRVVPITADVCSTDLTVGPVDLAWSSSVFHELADPGAALMRLHDLVAPGGVLAIMEMDAPPRLLTEEHAELESRLRAAAGADASAPDWSGAIGEARFELVERAVLTSDRTLPGHGLGGQYAVAELRRLAHHGAHLLAPDDQTALSGLLGDDGAHLREVRIRGTRTLWIARRAHG